MEHPKTSNKLYKTLRQAENISQTDSNSSLYRYTKKWKYFKRKKNAKITKRAHAFKGYTGSYNVEFLNTFNAKLQLKDTESAIKNKLKKNSLN